MTDLYDDVEKRVLALLKAWDGLRTVRTFEAEVRESLYSADQPVKSFQPTELPAIQVTAVNNPTESEPFSAGEMKYSVPVTVFVIVRGTVKDQVRRDLRALQFEVEKCLNRARRSTDELGVNAVVMGRLQSTVAVAQDSMFYFGLGQVEATVVKVVEL